jgi:hypothetical protein
MGGECHIIPLCLEREIRLEDGHHKTVRESDPGTLSRHRACALREPFDYGYHRCRVCIQG